MRYDIYIYICVIRRLKVNKPTLRNVLDIISHTVLTGTASHTPAANYMRLKLPGCSHRLGLFTESDMVMVWFS